MDELKTILLEFVEYPEDGGEPLVVGKAELSSDGELRLIEALGSHFQKIGQAVASVNRRDGLHVGIPPVEGAPKFAVASRFVPRRFEGEYINALQDHFRKYIGLELEDARLD